LKLVYDVAGLGAGGMPFRLVTRHQYYATTIEVAEPDVVIAIDRKAPRHVDRQTAKPLRKLQIGKRFRNKPLIWPTLYHSLMFLVLLLILTTLEELLVGLIEGRALADSLAHVVGPTFYQGVAVSLLMFLILLPYSAFTCLGDVLGEREVFRLFFVDPSAAVRNRLVGGPVPPA
jgi:hypothetical protein